MRLVRLQEVTHDNKAKSIIALNPKSIVSIVEGPAGVFDKTNSSGPMFKVTSSIVHFGKDQWVIVDGTVSDIMDAVNSALED